MSLRPALWLVLVLGALTTSILVWRLRPEPAPAKEPAARSDYILRDFELVMLGEQGQESMTVSGPYLERDPDGRSLSLTEPRFSFPDQQAGRWQAQARRAWVSAKADEVRLLEEVEFLGPLSARGLQTRFSTERLDIFPELNQARSDAEVTITQGDSILRGTALRADMAAQRFQLARTQARYAPLRP